MEAAERLGVSARRLRQLVERGQLPAVRRGPIWLTTSEAVDHFRRNTTPGGGRPLAERTAWARIADLADTGTLRDLNRERVALRARARHGRYLLDHRLASRFGQPRGTLRSGLAALDVDGDAIDLYAPATIAERLLKRTSAQQHPAGQLHLHVVDTLPTLDERPRLVLAWLDLVDRDHPAAELAAEALWPGTSPVQHLADLAQDEVDLTVLRGFVDWVGRHPVLAERAIARRPRRTGDPHLDSLLAATAETLADDLGFRRPAWTRRVPPAPDATPGSPEAAPDVPAAFAARGIHLPRETLWRS